MARTPTTIALLAGVAATMTITGAGAQVPGVRSARPIDSSAQCLPAKALAEADIVMLSQYGGRGVAVPYQIRGAQHGTRAVVVTGDPGRPVVLVLSAYESTVWDLSRVPSGRIRGVVASGFYAQGVIGLPESIPVAMRHRSADNGMDRDVDATACPDTNFAYSGPKVRSAAGAIRSSLGRYPVEFFGAYATSGYNLAGGPIPSYSDEPTGTLITERPVVTDGLRSGHEGLRQLVASGVLRPVTNTDLQRWHSQGGRFDSLNQMANMRSRYGGDMPSISEDGFLITRNVSRLPGGLDGAHSVIFFVPEGVSAPYEMQTHSSFYKIKGIHGIPATSSISMNEGNSFSRFLARSSGGGGDLHHARWKPDGTLISETPGAGSRDNSEGPWQIGSFDGSGSDTESIFEPSRMRYVPSPSPYMPAPSRPIEIESDRGMTPTALVSALLLTLGALGSILNRRKTTPDFPEVPATPKVRRPEDEPVQAPPAIQQDIDRISLQLQEAIDASRDDETALVLLKFKRTVARAMQDLDYDDDIANELDVIVDRHMAETVSIYLKAIKRTSESNAAILEENLRNSIHRLTRRIEELLESQSARDADRLREHEAFIRSRHPDDTLGGEQ